MENTNKNFEALSEEGKEKLKNGGSVRTAHVDSVDEPFANLSDEGKLNLIKEIKLPWGTEEFKKKYANLDFLRKAQASSNSQCTAVLTNEDMINIFEECENKRK